MTRNAALRCLQLWTHHSAVRAPLKRFLKANEPPWREIVR